MASGLVWIYTVHLLHVAHVSIGQPCMEKWAPSRKCTQTQFLLSGSGTQTRSLAPVLRWTWKDLMASNDFVASLAFALSPAETYRTPAKPLALAGRALVPVSVMVPEQVADPLAPEIGVPSRSQSQDTTPEVLPLHSRVHEPDAWAEAGAVANIESARTPTIAQDAEIVGPPMGDSRIRIGPEYLAVALSAFNITDTYRRKCQISGFAFAG